MLQEEIDLNIAFIALALIGILIVVAIIALFSIFMSKKNKITSEKLRAQLDYQKRLHQSELKALQGQMNPHFVHNSINAIQYYIQRNEVDISEHYLSKFSKLLRLFFEYSRRQYVSIIEEKELLENYLEIEKLRFEDKIQYQISIDPKIDVDEVRLPSMMLQPIVENAVNHGLFHKKGNGMIQVQFNYIDENTYQVVIEDDGVGILKTLAQKKAPLKNVTAHSSNVLAERVELLNLSKEWSVIHQTIDLKESTGGSGTRVSLIFSEILDRQ